MTDQASPGNVRLNDGLGPTRTAFEAWASREGWPHSDLADKCAEGAPRGGEYRHQGLQDAWEVWEAASAELRNRFDDALHDAVMRALDEAGVRNEVLRGMCVEVALERARDCLGA
jgi:hypothetical protein